MVNDLCFPHLLLRRYVFSWAVCVKCQIFVKSLTSKFSLTPALCTSRQNPISKQLCWNIFRYTYIRFVSKAEKKWFTSTILCFLNNVDFTVASASEKQSLASIFLPTLLEMFSFAFADQRNCFNGVFFPE